MTNDQIQTQLIATNGIGTALDYGQLAFTQKAYASNLTVEPAEGGFIVAGYFGGSHRRCVAATVPALVKLLRTWTEQYKPKKDA